MSTAVHELLGLPAWSDDGELVEYVGGCHCGKFRYKFRHPRFHEGEYEVVSCNCSWCKSVGKLNM